MDVLKRREFYKTNSTRRMDELKAASNLLTKHQRQLSRHAIRQSNRNIGDSEEENIAPAVPHQSKRRHIDDANGKIILLNEQYLARVKRLHELQAQKRRLLEHKASQKAQFIPYVSSKGITEPAKAARKLVEDVKRKAAPKPLCVMQLPPTENARERKINTIHPAGKFVSAKPRVDCWQRKDVLNQLFLRAPPAPDSAKRSVSVKKKPMPMPVARNATPKVFVMPAAKVPTAKKAASIGSKQRLDVGPRVVRPQGAAAAAAAGALVTSTARKSKKPLTFTFDSASRLAANKTKNTLTVANDVDSLFDGISPIEVEPSPRKSPAVPRKPAKEGDSIWEPQQVACLLEATRDITAHETDAILVEESALNGRKAALNESFTINYDDNCAEDSIFGCRPTIEPVESVPVVKHAQNVRESESEKCSPVSIEADKMSRSASRRASRIWSIESVPKVFEPSPSSENSCTTAKCFNPMAGEKCAPVSPVAVEHSADTPSPPPEVADNMTVARHASRVWAVEAMSENCAPSPSLENSFTTENCIVQHPAASTLLRKRSSLAFKEEPIGSVISPSVANMTMAEKDQLEKRCSFVVASVEEGAESTTPKEVLEKTRFYYAKVDSELARLQALCGEYAPYLDGELSDHCKGLINAAQGQTNILINKKLTKFRELIGHYEAKWNDRKVRNDDLDGFWLMLSLDLENLDKRFDELRVLRTHNWQEEVKPDSPPPKVKKLQGGGVKKRENKRVAGPGKASSSIANFIRQARQEQLRQKAAKIDLGELAETVTVVTSPVKKSVRIAGTPKRSSLRRRSSLCTGCTPTTIHWEQASSPASRKRQTIYPDLSQRKDRIKSILKTPSVPDRRRAKSVLFLDSGLDTPQTRRRQSSRRVVDTPKPKIKFNDELEIEHIDNLEARTPSRLEMELRNRRQQSQLLFSVQSEADERRNDSGRKALFPAAGTPKPSGGRGRDSSSAVKRRGSRSSRNLSAALQNSVNCEDEEESDEKRVTRASTRKTRKRTIDFS